MPVVFPQLDARKRLERKYGTGFPDLNEKDDAKRGEQFRTWLQSQRENQASLMQDRRLHWSRHRNFRVGNQHISTRDGKTWREPYATENQIRAVNNIIGPSLDFRHGVIAEQKPGFRYELLKATIDAREKAEAQQAVAEFYFHSKNVWQTWRDAIYHAQTDGVCFVQAYVDKLAGPQAQNVKKFLPDDELGKRFLSMGYQQDEQGFVIVPLTESGAIGNPDDKILMIPEGDLAYRLILAHDTFVDPEARTLNGEGDRARWFCIRRPRDIHIARIETQNAGLEPEELDSVADCNDSPIDNASAWLRGLPPFPSGNRNKFKESVYEWALYIAPDGEDIEQGMWARLIGNTIVDEADELPGGVYPFARFTDGSPDPSFYPRPTMSAWIGDQITINALESLLIQHARIHGLGRLMGLKGTTITESYNTIVGSMLEYEGMKPEQLKAMNSGSDVWELRNAKIRELENKTGWNDLARGQVLGQAGGGMQDVSGRAVLGAREMLERTFGPMVQATAEGATEWCDITVKLAAWLYGDTPRIIPTVGGRGDLAKKISRTQLEGDVSTYVDPATMMPQPAQLRQQTLQELLEKQMISLAEYQKRAPYAEIRNVYMGDMDHWQRAQIVNTVLEENWEELVGAEPMQLYGPDGLVVLWQDDPTVHLNALNELILNERKPWPLRKLAADRAGIYEQLAQAKLDPMQPVPLEVLGVPLNRLQAQAAVATAVPTPTNVNPGAVPAEAAAQPGIMSPVGSDSAEPLGTLGSVEQAISPDMTQL